jgi:hypothetical protein
MEVLALSTSNRHSKTLSVFLTPSQPPRRQEINQKTSELLWDTMMSKRKDSGAQELIRFNDEGSSNGIQKGFSGELAGEDPSVD